MSDSQAPGASQSRYELPAGATRIVLVRHGAARVMGESEPLDLVDGHNDPPLAAAGRDQAQAVGDRLREEGPQRIFVSPLRRTAETAAPLAASLGLEPEVLPELREVHLGEWEGRYAHRVASRDPLLARVMAEQRWDVIPGAEPTAAFQARVATALERVVATTGPGGSAAVFAHGAVIAESCRAATGSQGLAFLFGENASLTRLAHLGEGRWLLRGFNDVSHLPDRLS
ncbi:MAG: histidine phosphatase family protein [Solirubrobacterales bacterium]